MLISRQISKSEGVFQCISRLWSDDRSRQLAILTVQLDDSQRETFPGLRDAHGEILCNEDSLCKRVIDHLQNGRINDWLANVAVEADDLNKSMDNPLCARWAIRHWIHFHKSWMSFLEQQEEACANLIPTTREKIMLLERSL